MRIGARHQSSFRCGYCRKTFRGGSPCFYIVQDAKRACMGCRNEMVDRVYGREG